MMLGLRTVIYPVTDLARGKAWYADVLGVAPYFDQPYYVGFAVGGFELGLDPGRHAGAGRRHRVLGRGRTRSPHSHGCRRRAPPCAKRRTTSAKASRSRR